MIGQQQEVFENTTGAYVTVIDAQGHRDYVEAWVLRRATECGMTVHRYLVDVQGMLEHYA